MSYPHGWTQGLLGYSYLVHWGMVSSISAAPSAAFTTNIFPHIVKCSLVGRQGEAGGWESSRGEIHHVRGIFQVFYVLFLLISRRVNILSSFVSSLLRHWVPLWAVPKQFAPACLREALIWLCSFLTISTCGSRGSLSLHPFPQGIQLVSFPLTNGWPWRHDCHHRWERTMLGLGHKFGPHSLLVMPAIWSSSAWIRYLLII